MWLLGGSSINVDTFGYQWGTMIADFNEDVIRFTYDSLVTMDFSGANISLSDNEGHLLMYSNGMGVHGKSHTPIPGLDSIGYGIFWERFNEKNYLPDGSDWPSGFPINQAVIMLPSFDLKNF